MLLLYVVFFMLVAVAPSIGRRALTPGWVGPPNRPELGGIYWIRPASYGLSDDKRVPCVVLFRLEAWRKTYGIVRLYTLRKKPPGAVSVKDYFEGLTLEKRKGPGRVDLYYILPRQVYHVEGDPIIMGLYRSKLTIVPEDGLDKLVAKSLGLVDGENGSVHDGGLYWIRPTRLGIKDTSENYNLLPGPCILLRTFQVGNEHMSHVVRVSNTQLHDREAVSATNFFEINAELKTGNKVDDHKRLSDFYIHYREKYEVAGVPKIMRVWNEGVPTIMKKADWARLVAMSGMVDGWDAQHKLELDGVYWIQPQFLTKPEVSKFRNYQVGVYIPCVVIDPVGDKCRIVEISSQFGQSASMYFSEDAKLQTPTGITTFQNYYFHPDDGYEVKCHPEIIQRWEEGKITVMPKESRIKLEEIVFPTHGDSGTPESQKTISIGSPSY